MQGSLSFEEHLRRARETLRLEKAAHAVTRANCSSVRLSLAQLKGLGGRPMTVDAETEGGPSDPLHGDIHMSLVAGDASGANRGVAGDVPPDAVVDEPAQSTEQTHSADAVPEERQRPQPDAQTSPVVGEEPGGEGNVGADNEDPPMRDDAVVNLEGTHSASPVPDGGESSHAAEME